MRMETGVGCPEYDVATTIVITTAHVTGAINSGWRNYTIYNGNTCVTIVTSTWPPGSGPTLQHIFLNVHSSLQAKCQISGGGGVGRWNWFRRRVSLRLYNCTHCLQLHESSNDDPDNTKTIFQVLGRTIVAMRIKGSRHKYIITFITLRDEYYIRMI